MSSWPLRRLDWLVAEERGTSTPALLGVEEVFHYSIPVFDAIGDGQLESPDDIGSGKLLLSGGEILVSKLNPRKPRVVTAASHTAPMMASTEFIALRPGPDVEPAFLRYWLGSERLRQELDGATMSVTRSQQRVRPEVLTKRWVAFPTRDIQRAIADYLDTETARIDALITTKKRLINALLERRQALTHFAVQGKLTGEGRSRKQTAIPWLPSMPHDWQEAPLTLVARLGSGHTPSRERPDWWVDCDIPWVTTGEVSQIRHDRTEYIYATRENISGVGLTNSAAELHPAGTVVLSRTASAGFSAIMGRDMATSQDFVTWSTGPLLESRFLLLCLRAMRADLLDRLAQGSTHKTIYMPDIRSIRVPLPPVEEQDDIVGKAWKQLRDIDAVVDRLVSQQRLLTEHRQALITAAVTGELKIPAAA
jgi:type I restriction enzyme S subunit